MARPTLGRLLTLLLCVVGSCLSQDALEETLRPLPTALPKPSDHLATGLNHFAHKLYQVLAGQSKENILFSPVSVSSCLMMAHLMTGGETSRELATGLQVQELHPDLAPAFTPILNNIKGGSAVLGYRGFVQDGFPVLESYLTALRTHLKAETVNVNFRDSASALQAVNSWVSQQTNGKIPSLMDPSSVNSDTLMVLLSTIYFKGSWQYKFNEKQTKDKKFTRMDGSVARIPMMKLTRKLGYFRLSDLQATVLHLPYSNREEWMVLVLPDQTDGLPQLEKALASQDLYSKVVDPVKFKKVKAVIPKIKLESNYELKSALKALGIRRIFDSERSDFSRGINSSMPLEVSTVRHKAVLECDEAGTVASAATGMGIMGRSLYVPAKPPQFVADHPFMFAIVNTKAKSILFLGRFSSP